MNITEHIEQVDNSSGIKEIDKTIKELKEQEHFHSGTYEITFNKTVNIPFNKRRYKKFDKMTVKLFVATNGLFCYTFYKRTGFNFLRHIKAEDVKEIKKIEKKEIVENRPHKAKLLRNKIYPNLWPELKEKTEEFLEANDFRESDLKPVYFLNRFHKWNRKGIEIDLKAAFDEKKDYKYKQYTDHHAGRDLSIEVKVNEDGSIRAWFSSEYKDCANGDYYLILNPKVAVFYQKD